jgi:hypothetical protein
METNETDYIGKAQGTVTTTLEGDQAKRKRNKGDNTNETWASEKYDSTFNKMNLFDNLT